MAAERRCARCNKPLPAGAGKSTTMCSDTCRTARIRSAIADRRRAGPIEMTWPSEVQSLVSELARIELELALATDGCDGETLARLRLRRRQLTGVVAMAKAVTMTKERVA